MSKKQTKSGFKILVSLVFIFMGLVLNGSILLNTDNMKHTDRLIQPISSSRALHAAIYIDGNDWFTAAGASGSGVKSDPYRIESLKIEGEYSGTYPAAIYIENSNVYAVIQNVEIVNTTNPIQFGIYLSNTTHCNITESIFNSTQWGVYIENCENCNITSNVAVNNSEAVLNVYNSPSIRFENNTIRDSQSYGIRITGSSTNCKMIENNITHMGDSGINTGHCENPEISGNYIDDCGYYGLVLTNTTGFMIKSNTLTHCHSQAINIRSGTDNLLSMSGTIQQNTIMENDLSGIYIDNCMDLLISDNNISYNHAHGIKIDYESTPNEITVNTLIKNDDGAIYNQNPSNNNIHDNTIIEYPKASFTIDSPTLKTNTPINFTDTSTGGRDPVTYLWNFDDGSTSTDENPHHIFSATGSYNVTLTITDADGDTSTSSNSIQVDKGDGSDESSIAGFSSPFLVLLSLISILGMTLVLDHRQSVRL